MFLYSVRFDSFESTPIHPAGGGAPDPCWSLADKGLGWYPHPELNGDARFRNLFPINSLNRAESPGVVWSRQAYLGMGPIAI